MRALSTPTASALPGWVRLALVFLAVPAILVGLLAMHVLTTGTSHAPDAHTSASHTSSVASGSTSADNLAGHSHETANCDGACGPEHDMLGMACVLALLMTALLLVLQLTLLRWGSPFSIASRVVARFAARAPARPPSLLVLSISRT